MITVIVNTCDEWQSYSSFKLVGVFTNRAILNIAIRELLREKAITLNGKAVSSQTIKELMVNLTYLNIREINLNKRQ